MGVATGTSNIAAAGSGGPPGAGGQAIAEQLARQMEEAQRTVESEMNQKMAELTAKLNAARAAAAKAEAEEASAAAATPITGDFDDSMDSGTASKADISFSYVHETRPVNHGPAAALTPREETSSYNDDAPLSPMLSDAEEEDAFFGAAAAATSGGAGDVPSSQQQQQEASSPTSKPVISMVETSFGAEELDRVADAEVYYVVEEDSDEEV